MPPTRPPPLDDDDEEQAAIEEGWRNGGGFTSRGAAPAFPLVPRLPLPSVLGDLVPGTTGFLLGDMAMIAAAAAAAAGES